jgi:uncharacterized membrane protein
MFLLFLHIVGVVLFLGNIVTAAFWKVKADVNKNPTIIHQTAKNVMLADYFFTIPGLILIIVSGNLMAVQAGYSMSEYNWFTLSMFLFLITGLIWGIILIPIQRKMIKFSAESVELGKVTDSYRRASMYWAIFGIIATLIPVGILYVMITKMS